MMLNSAVILLTLFSFIDGAQKHMANVLSPLSQKVVANISHGDPIWDKSESNTWQNSGTTRNDGAMGNGDSASVGNEQCKSFKIEVSDCSGPVQVGVATDGWTTGADHTQVSIDTIWGQNVGKKSIQTYSGHPTLTTDSQYHICSPAGSWDGTQTMDLCIDMNSRCWNVNSSLGALTIGLFPQDWETVYPSVYNSNSACKYTISAVDMCSGCCEGDCGSEQTKGAGRVPGADSNYELVGNGWCLFEENRVGLRNFWRNTNLRADNGADECEQLCDADANCIGYQTEDGTKCQLMPGTQDGNAYTEIDGVDNEIRNWCWQKKSACDCSCYGSHYEPNAAAKGCLVKGMGAHSNEDCCSRT